MRRRATSRSALARLALAALGLGTWLGGCGSQPRPAGFWSAYRAEHIEAKAHLFEGRRGWSWIHWSHPDPGFFGDAAVLHFAQEQGWIFQDRVELQASELEDWTQAGAAVFPFRAAEPPVSFGSQGSQEGPGSQENRPAAPVLHRFPRHIETNASLSRYDSRWLLEGLSDFETAPGYILISEDGRRMAVYHAWGRD